MQISNLILIVYGGDKIEVLMIFMLTNDSFYSMFMAPLINYLFTSKMICIYPKRKGLQNYVFRNQKFPIKIEKRASQKPEIVALAAQKKNQRKKTALNQKPSFFHVFINEISFWNVWIPGAPWGVGWGVLGGRLGCPGSNLYRKTECFERVMIKVFKEKTDPTAPFCL
jgi:hypothetical protein